ncbi:Glutamine synthetase 3 [Nitrospina gracilis 3/211]|uniref:Glutamine synthetase 3 n=1 Tax=Nitrospina gracilis (strain 3/211) TaxID=1266370 RepID=M1YVZ0_NITG3|nr:MULTISPECIES: type III glutamate--ammonia ligase [Nitrospina]MCF8722850.1 glutamine synthetase [Nitrospina sp. Nb-3]CCQ89810.1 Glutamine synthetase 3 [Nitrospina gracilis 3/211]
MLSESIKKHKTEYLLVSFVDLFGVIRSKLIPASKAKEAEKAGAGFAGFAAHLNLTPAHPDIFLMPDAKTFTPMAWQPNVAWITGDLYMDGELIDHAPRTVLKRAMAAAAKKRVTMMTGVEAEFFLLAPDGSRISDEYDQLSKPCYDQLALMRRFDFIKEVCDAMQGLGWEPYQNDHEDANGQYEMNWHYSSALETADRHVFFRFLTKSIAEKHGLRVSFMPKPFTSLTGNGCHTHCSLWDASGKKNLFLDKNNSHQLSEKAYQFIAGVLHHAPALSALTNPTVNSFKRLNAKTPDSGATWSPNGISYGGNNRTHMIRIPDAGRFELRLPDGAANPYLLQAGILTAGMDGIENKMDPGVPRHENMYDVFTKLKVKKLPATLYDALAALEKNHVFKTTLGDGFVDSYLKLKREDWSRYMSQVSEWERQSTLDC